MRSDPAFLALRAGLWDRIGSPTLSLLAALFASGCAPSPFTSAGADHAPGPTSAAFRDARC